MEENKRQTAEGWFEGCLSGYSRTEGMPSTERGLWMAWEGARRMKDPWELMSCLRLGETVRIKQNSSERHAKLQESSFLYFFPV